MASYRLYTSIFIRFYSTISVQVFIAVIVGGISIVLGLKYSRKYIKKNIKQEKLMMGKYIGQEFVANIDIAKEEQMKVNGVYWRVKNIGSQIASGESFVVVDIENNKLIIKREMNKNDSFWFFFLTVLVIILLLVILSVKVVNTGYVYILERFGQFYKILEPGWHITIPFADFVRAKISMKQQILDIPPQNVITKDNVKISVDNVIFLSSIKC